MYKHIILVVALSIIAAAGAAFCADKSVKDKPVVSLSEEMGSKGWIVYSSRSSNGTDLQSGTVQANDDNMLTIEKLKISNSISQLRVKRVN